MGQGHNSSAVQGTNSPPAPKWQLRLSNNADFATPTVLYRFLKSSALSLGKLADSHIQETSRLWTSDLVPIQEIKLKTCTSLECGQKLEHPEKSHRVTGRMCKVHTDSSQVQNQTRVTGTGREWPNPLRNCAGSCSNVDHLKSQTHYSDLTLSLISSSLLFFWVI